MAQYTPNTWSAGDVLTKTKLDRLEAGTAAAIPKDDADLAYVPAARPTKRSQFVIGSDLSSQLNVYSEYLASVVVTLPVATTRWRLRIANRVLAGPVTGPLTLSPIYKGQAKLTAAGKWAGDFVAAPVQVLPAPTMPTDGSDVVTGWVTSAGDQFSADAPLALTYAVQVAAGQIVGYGSNGVQHVRYDTGSFAQVANATRTGGGTDKGALLDVRIEYEHVGYMGREVRHVFVAGDSLSSGVVDDGATYSGVHSPSNSWPVLAGALNRAAVTNASVAGTNTTNFVDVTKWNYTRFDLATTPPDDIIIAHGNNNVVGSASLADYQTQLGALITVLKTFNPKRIFLATLIPVPGFFKAGALVAPAAVGATEIITNIPYANGDAIDIGYGTTTYERRTASAASTAVATGGWSTLVPALTNAHPVNCETHLVFESTRRQYNAWIRTAPHGVTVIDFERVLLSPVGPSSTSPDRTLWGTGATHPGRGAYERMAACVRL